MNFTARSASLAEVAQRTLDGSRFGFEVKDFLHEFQDKPDFAMLAPAPAKLTGRIEHGDRWDAFLQALAVYLAARIDRDPPQWTQPPLQLPDPWFASPGPAIRNYLLLSSPAPFRTRNLFVDEDSLSVV
jgi:hypothetical protein